MKDISATRRKLDDMSPKSKNTLNRSSRSRTDEDISECDDTDSSQSDESKTPSRTANNSQTVLKLEKVKSDILIESSREMQIAEGGEYSENAETIKEINETDTEE